MPDFLRFFLILNMGLIVGYGCISYAEAKFKTLRPPYKYIQPKGLLKYILRYSNKKQGIVNVCFWAEIISLGMILVSNSGLILLYQFGVFSNEKFFWGYALFFFLIDRLINWKCRSAMIDNNSVVKN